MSSSTAGPHQHTNRLAKETSPYLLQHQHNPVDWYPWGEEAFERARRENKPIFLSVGYSTCYWCHVMERQCFEVEAVAAEMNARFVNIKVDREERPDVDQLYMTAVQILTRHGGWPMSVWLTPDLRPFYAGTYFPPPKFLQILAGLDEAWRERRDEVEQSTVQIVNYLQQLAKPPAPRAAIGIDHQYIDGLIERIVADYDPVHGGFGGAPKFPRETELEFLLVHNRLRPQPATQDSQFAVMKMLRHTLHAMAQGGIRDQLGGGFHRYSTDAEWLVPHFEIMLYDNAMLGWVYAEAFAQTGEEAFQKIARGIFDFVLREMTSPAGLFYTALDAEVDGQEGLNYLWTAEQIEAVLGAEGAKVFNLVYGVDRGPNFVDPHHGAGAPDQNILFLPQPMPKAATQLGMSENDLEIRLAPMRQKLKAARDQRKQPLLDTKVITSWNALMIRALAHGGQLLKDARYVEAARRAAEALLQDDRSADGGLYRTSREGAPKYAGFLDDYAFLAQACLALRDAGAAGEWESRASELIEQTISKFGDPKLGGFYFTEASATDLIVRQKTGGDSPLPSGNAVAVMVLLEMGRIDEARKAIGLFAQSIESQAEGMSSMVQAAALYLKDHVPFAVSPYSPTATPDLSVSSPVEMAQDVVTVSANWEGPDELQLGLSIRAPYHIHSHEEASEGVPMIPTRVTLEGATDFSIDYPPPQSQRFPFSDEPIDVYQGEITITIRPKLGSAERSLRLRLSYQACDDQSCLPPVTKVFGVSRP